MAQEKDVLIQTGAMKLVVTKKGNLEVHNGIRVLYKGRGQDALSWMIGNHSYPEDVMYSICEALLELNDLKSKS